MTLRIDVAKTWQLDELAQQSRYTRKVNTWVYYCTLCDEVLLVTRRFVEPKGVQAAFDEVCPDCGFDLKDIMSCERVWLSRVGSTYVNTKHPKAALLEESLRAFEGIRPRSAHLPAEEQILTTGIEKLDRLVQLATGQFVVFRSLSPPASLTELLCVRAQLHHPVGLNSDAIFIDGGNRFDVHAISHYTIKYGIEPKFALSRIHISRAFTYFQLASLLTEKLPNALKRCSSKFVVVSGITELFHDPEIKDKQEAHRVFQRILHSLSAVVEITGSLVIATSFSQNIRFYDTALMQAAHATIFTEEHDAFTRFAIVHHKSLPPRKTLPREDRAEQSLRIMWGTKNGENYFIPADHHRSRACETEQVQTDS